MNPQSQTFKTTPTTDEKRLVALSVAAVLLVDLGLAVLVVDDEKLIPKAAAFIQTVSAPGLGLTDQGKKR